MISKEQVFWDWFKNNNSKYFYLNQINDQSVKDNLLDLLLQKLHSYCDKLYFEIGGYKNQDQELIITAEGNINYFDQVERLIGKAPKIDGWKFIAFKPAMGVD